MPLTGFPGGISTPIVVGPSSGFQSFGVNGPSGSNVFYVNSANAAAADSAGTNGTSPATPFKTLNFAITQCKANNGDVIYVGPQHVESVSAAGGLTVGVAGVTIIGQGNQVDRAQVNYLTSTAATVLITAANAVIVGLRFLNSIDARVDGIVISGADCTLYDCEFADATGASSLISIRSTNAAVRLRLGKLRCYFAENTGTARTEFLRIVGGSDHEIRDFYNDAAATFSTAVINNVTTASAGLLMADAVVQNGTTAVAAAFVAGSIVNLQRCFFSSTGVSAVTMPTAGNYNVDESTKVLGGATGSNPYMGRIAPGAPVAFQKSFTSSSLTTSDQTFITATGGSVIIDGITVETDATGLAGGTNHQLDTNNANGLLVLAAETVANLGANKAIDLTAASVTALKVGFVLESTKVLQLKNTVGAGTGAGKIFYNVRGRVMSGAPVLS